VHGAPEQPKALEDAKKNAEQVQGKVMEADPEEMAKKDIKMLREVFLPGLAIQRSTLVSACIGISAGVLWFVIYFKMCYRSDFSVLPTDWAQLVEARAIAERTGTATPRSEPTPRRDAGDMRPDLCIVFHHPDHDYPDNDKTMLPEAFNKVVVESAKSKESRQHSEDGTLGLARIASHKPKSERKATSASKTVGLPDDAEDAHNGPPISALSRREARVALLADMYSCLHAWGFEVLLFSSIDNDELFCCITLKDEDQMKKFAIQNHLKMQVKKEVVAQMEIGQDPDAIESSPPYIKYDPKMVRHLHNAGVLKEQDPSLLYQLTDRPVEGAPKIANSLERARIIFTEIQHHLDLDAAEEEGLIVGWYPVHDPDWLSELRHTWASWWHLRDFTFIQPVNLIYQYYGSRVAFNCAWNGFYCKALLALLGIALFTELFVFGAQAFLKLDAEQVNHMLKRQILAFSIITIIWSRIVSNRWLREEEFGIRLWDIHDKACAPRPQFIGEMLPSTANSNELEIQYPPWKHTLRRAFSVCTTGLFCSAVFFVVVLWMRMFKGNLTLMQNILLAVQIKIFEVIWNILSPMLTDFENHRLQATYYNSLLWKQFIFQAVNNYSFFLYIAVKQRFSEEGCPAGGCLHYLRLQLSITLMILAICRIVQVCMESFIVKMTLEWEMYQLRKQGVEEVPERSVEEEQAKYGQFRIKEQIVGMYQLVLGLGYVTLFGAIAPIVVPFCFIVFWISLRAQAYSLTHSLQRPVPRVAVGIGAWRDVVAVIMQAGVIFNAFQLVVYGEDFQGAHVLARLTAGTVFLMCMYLTWAVVDVMDPPYAGENSLLSTLIARRRKVEETLNVKAEVAAHTKDEPRKPAFGRRATMVKNAIQTGVFTAIPKLNDTPPDTPLVSARSGPSARLQDSATMP
jgi:hypothetical protein